MLDQRLAAIAAAPHGPSVAAFFDFDGTIIDGYSAFALIQERARRLQIGPVEAASVAWVGARAAAGVTSVDELMAVGVGAWRGKPVEELERLGRGLARSALGGMLIREVLALIDAHQAQGHTVVIASSALPFQVEPLAAELGITEVLCTRPEVCGGRPTGRLAGSTLWGSAKARAVVGFAAERAILLDGSFGYANGAEDIEFLASVGHPCAVNPHPQLAEVARRRGWSRLDARGPRRAGVTDAARTVAAYAGMATSFGAGLGLGLLNRSRREATNLSMSIGSDVALSLAGVKVDVVGEGHLWSARPAVFVFNHQSWLDGLIIMQLLRGDVTGVAKKEVASQPGFGQFAKLANMAFVDRANGASARKALEPAIARLREGYSIVLAPEGTRSVTPRLGAFKKGAFHLAMQGGVPMVPIVVRNAGELLWRGSTVIRPGTVDVIVHPPVDTEDWTRATLDEHVADVRGLFLRTLADWDGVRATLRPQLSSGVAR